jgi:hypothetical protein
MAGSRSVNRRHPRRSRDVGEIGHQIDSQVKHLLWSRGKAANGTGRLDPMTKECHVMHGRAGNETLAPNGFVAPKLLPARL